MSIEKKTNPRLEHTKKNTLKANKTLSLEDLIEYITQNPKTTIEYVDLSYRSLYSSDIQNLVHSLITSEVTIKKIDLRGNFIGDEGAKLLNNITTSIVLDNNFISDEQMWDRENTISQNKAASKSNEIKDAENKPQFSDKSLIQENSEIKEYTTKFESTKFKEAIKKEICLVNTLARIKSKKHELPKTREINLSSQKLSHEQVIQVLKRILSKKKKNAISTLNLSDNDLENSEKLLKLIKEVLVKQENIQLILGGNKFEENDINQLKEQSKKAKVYTDNNQYYTEKFDANMKEKEIYRVDLKKIKKESRVDFSELTQKINIGDINEINFSYLYQANNITELACAFKTNKKQIKFKISYNNLSSEDCRKLLNQLLSSFNDILNLGIKEVYINIEGNNFDDDCIILLCQILHKSLNNSSNFPYININLDSNKISESHLNILTLMLRSYNFLFMNLETNSIQWSKLKDIKQISNENKCINSGVMKNYSRSEYKKRLENEIVKLSKNRNQENINTVNKTISNKQTNLNSISENTQDIETKCRSNRERSFSRSSSTSSLQALLGSHTNSNSSLNSNTSRLWQSPTVQRKEPNNNSLGNFTHLSQRSRVTYTLNKAKNQDPDNNNSDTPAQDFPSLIDFS